MFPRKFFLHITALISFTLHTACMSDEQPTKKSLGRFDTGADLFLAHFDSKTDVDDIHSVAAVATMLADPRFSSVRYHAVAGAYGIQEGLYVPANELFELSFGTHWSDAHSEYQSALDEVTELVSKTLESGGKVWIAEAGQSDFSADLVKRIRARSPDIDTGERIQIVQHSDWNEEVTTPEDLSYVKEQAAYHKIPDGNGLGNGTPGFRSDAAVVWRKHIEDARLVEIWEMAIRIANTFNAQDGRYDNTAIGQGGMDFSDVAETCWIFGFEGLADANAFFKEFATAP